MKRRLIEPEIHTSVLFALLQRDLKGELLGIPTRRKTLTDDAVPTKEKLSWPIPRTVNDRRYLPTGMVNRSVHFTQYPMNGVRTVGSRVVTPPETKSAIVLFVGSAAS